MDVFTKRKRTEKVGELFKSEIELDPMYKGSPEPEVWPEISPVIARDYDYDVSVLMPMYEPDMRKLRQSIESVQAQGGVRLQLVMVNDGSVLGMMQKELPGIENVIVINLHENMGTAAALNQAAMAATGEYCIVLEDDRFALGALARLYHALKGSVDPVNTFAYGDVALESGVHITPEWAAHQRGERFRTSYAVMWHRSHYGKVRFHKPEDLPFYFQDVDFVLQLEAAGVKGLKVPGVVLHYERTDGGVSVKARKFEKQIREALAQRWDELNGAVK